MRFMSDVFEMRPRVVLNTLRLFAITSPLIEEMSFEIPFMQ